MLKIATWNVNSLRMRLPQVLDWLEREKPDMLGLQEIKLSDHEFPEEAFTQLGYHAIWAGQKTFNGVAILSKIPPTNVVTGIPGFEDKQQRILAATIGDTRFITIYVPNGQSVNSEKYFYKLQWFSHLQSYLVDVLLSYPKTVLVGDFNIAPEDRDVCDPRSWEGHVLVSEQERTAFFKLIASGFSDTFRLFEQPAQTYSWWDYRGFAFQRNQGLRIDHVLASPVLALDCIRSWIDKTPRDNDRPSDHAPAIAEFLS